MSEPTIKDVSPVMALTCPFTGPYNQTSAVMDEVMAWLLQTGHPYSGNPFAIYYEDPAKVDEDKLKAQICLPVAEALEKTGEYEQKEVEGGTFVSLRHEGPYDEISSVYETLFDWIKENNFEYLEEMGTREIFLKILGEVDTSEELLTEVLVPVKTK